MQNPSVKRNRQTDRFANSRTNVVTHSLAAYRQPHSLADCLLTASADARV